jgi:predicted AlkP superfamily pyrophosphatase or phosphodiesterase
MKLLFAAAALAATALTAPALAQTKAPKKPQLIVAISVDQLSTELFNRYRPHFTGGMKRMADGVAFANGYQAHGSTETCQGHSTILTGSHPARTGIVANTWYDRNALREDKAIYCSEDERIPGMTSRNYSVSPYHLEVPTLGDRMKKADPASRVVAVAGKDRSAVMMGGHAPDQRWFWKSGAFISDLATTPAPVVAQVNASVAKALAAPRQALTPPPFCADKDATFAVGDMTLGAGRFAREGGDASAFTRSPELDGATLAMAGALFQQMQLGRGGHTDLLAIGLSATDYIGHGYGNGGMEMCLQMASLDADLAGFFALLDRSGVDYMVALTADHGALDLPERLRAQGVADAARLLESGTPEAIGAEVGRRLGIAGEIFAGDWYVSASVPAERRAEVVAVGKQLIAAHPQVAEVHSAAEVAATAIPKAAPERWSMRERLRASYHPGRSPDLFVVLKPNIMPVPEPRTGYVVDHGSAHDHDRMVPILFWRPGIAADDRSESAMTVDILPTLASLIGLDVPQGEIDGKCLDIAPGEVTNCR